MKYLKGTKGSKRGLYTLVERVTPLPKMQEVEILPAYAQGNGLALRWRGGFATLLLMNKAALLKVKTMGEPEKRDFIPLSELEKLGLIDEG